MSYSCTGPTFTPVATDYTNFDNDGEYIVAVAAATTWDENTKAKVTVEWMNMTFKKKDIVLCDELVDSSDCGQVGTFELDFGPELISAGITSSTIIAMFDNANAYTKIETKIGKSKEICTKNAPTSIQTFSNPMVTGSSSAASVVSTLFGAFALVGLAGYAWKRRTSSTSENDADQRLYSGDVA